MSSLLVNIVELGLVMVVTCDITRVQSIRIGSNIPTFSPEARSTEAVVTVTHLRLGRAVAVILSFVLLQYPEHVVDDPVDVAHDP